MSIISTGIIHILLVLNQPRTLNRAVNMFNASVMDQSSFSDRLICHDYPLK
jgi:hypothetical protein